MKIKWSDDFKTGIQEIDDWHKTLFRKINFLLSAMHKGKAEKETENLTFF